jgi:predicted CxxxxCH...CXXCH cytochrome family protein
MTWKSLAVPSVAAALLAACGVARDVSEPMAADRAASCSGCHGDASRSGLAAAAPADAAHDAHVGDAGVACGACHVVPASAAHANGTVEVTFAAPATANGADPVYAGGTCSGVYCHGGTGSTASWGGGALACDGCHGQPPADSPHAAHVARAGVACGTCHVLPASGAHANGTAEVTFSGIARANGAQPAFESGTCSGVYCHGGAGSTVSWTGGALACGSCHGAPPAPPHTSSTACASCHSNTLNPDGTIDASKRLHANGTKDVPAAGAAHPQGWGDPSAHGAAAKQGLASCQTCHGFDFAGGTSGRSCNACHGGTAWMTNCTFCHGTKVATYTGASLVKAAPPRGAGGELATTDRAVGAHAKHLSGGTFGKAVACAECHAVPTDLAHLDGSAAVAFGAESKRDGARPAWNGTTCASTYCHGGTLSGGSDSAPTWTGGAAEVACGSCHGLPPLAPHTSSTACKTCHGYDAASFDAARHLNGTIDRVAGATHAAGFAAKEQHGYEVNRSGLASCKGCHGATLTGGAGPSCGSCHAGGGTAWATNCTFCHGTGTQSAPPVDTQGRSVATNVSVGLHANHLGSTIMTAPACTQCHASRGDVITDAAHVDGDGVAEVQLGTLARTGGAPATYARTSATAATCASTYCHGRFTGGANATGTQPAMSWTSTTQVSCTSCHGAPPSSGRHSKHSGEATCGDCHPGYTTSAVAKATHLDGTKQVGGIAGWNATSRSCSNSCHGTERW